MSAIVDKYHISDMAKLHVRYLNDDEFRFNVERELEENKRTLEQYEQKLKLVDPALLQSKLRYYRYNPLSVRHMRYRRVYAHILNILVTIHENRTNIFRKINKSNKVIARTKRFCEIYELV